MIGKIIRKIKKNSPFDLLNELSKSKFSQSNVNKIFNDNININWKNECDESFLHICVKKGLIESIKWLLKNGAEVNITTFNDETPLFYAVLKNNRKITKLLIENGANVDYINIHKRTPLQEAVISNNTKVIDILIQNSNSINNIDEHGHNLIFDALSNGNINLISEIADYKNLNINQIDNNGNTILHQNAILKDNSIAIKLLEKGADPTIKDKNGKNFLFYAVRKGMESKSVINKAIELGCNLNSRSNKQQTILMEIILTFSKLTFSETKKRKSLLLMLKKLIKDGVSVHAIDDKKETALFLAVRTNNLEATLLLLNQDKSLINYKNCSGYSVLDIAVFGGISYLNILLVLLKFSANVNNKDLDGKSIIETLIDIILYYQNKKAIDKNLLIHLNDEGQYLVVLKEILDNTNVNLLNLNSKGKPLVFDVLFYKNEYLYNLLKKYGADINQKDSDDRNIIYNLMKNEAKELGLDKNNYISLLKYLISLGADVNSRDNFGGITIHKAILDNDVETTKVLLNSKIDIKAIDTKGRTLIHNCVWKGKIKQFKLIHSFDSNILNIPDNFGVLPINYAAFMGQVDLVIEMIANGAHVNNPHKKNYKMLSFLDSFHDKLDGLHKNVESELDKKNIKMLIQNMKKEFLFN